MESRNKNDAKRHYGIGISALLQAKATADSSNCEELLMTADNHLERAIDQLEKTDPCYAVYSQAYASVKAHKLTRLGHPAEIDNVLSSSPLLGNILAQRLDISDDLAIEIDIHEAVLDALWSSLNEACNKLIQASSEPPSNDSFAKCLFSFDQALACSLNNHYLQYLWHTYRANFLYLHVGLRQPDRVGLCIASMNEVQRLGSATKPGRPADIDPSLLKLLPDEHIDLPLLCQRLVWLKTLASLYIHRHTSIFWKCVNSYQLYPSLELLWYIIVEGGFALRWSQNTGLLPRLRSNLLLRFGQALYERYQIDLCRMDLESSAEYLREGLDCNLVPEDQSSFYKQVLSNVTADLAEEFSINSQSEDLLRSLVLWRESVSLTGHEVPEVLAERLVELANTSFQIYEQYDEGTSAHISEAVECLARAADVSPNPLNSSEILLNQADMHYARYEREGNIHSDLEMSFRSGNEAWGLIHQLPGLILHERHWARLSRHGARTIDRIETDLSLNRFVDVEEIPQIITLLENLLRYPFANARELLNNLGRAHKLFYDSRARGGEPTIERISSLKTSLQYHRRALETTWVPDVNDRLYSVNKNRCHTFVGLINYELSRISELNDTVRLQYLEEAIYHLDAVTSRRIVRDRANLAIALEARYRMMNQPQDIERCIVLLQPLSDISTIGNTMDSLLAALQLIRICREHNFIFELLPAYRLLFGALRRLSHLGLASKARHKTLVENSFGHACDAAAMAILTKDFEAAVELLEDGRGLFYSQMIPTQVDINRVRDVDPKLANHLENVLDEFSLYTRAIDADGYKASYRDVHSMGRAPFVSDQAPESLALGDLAYRLESLCADDVQRLPGFEGIMKPKVFSELKGAAKRCPVVYINISQYRCDAIILRSPESSPQVSIVPLPISLSEMYDLSHTMQTVVKMQGRETREGDLGPARHVVWVHPTVQSPNSVVRDILKRLWDCVVYRVLGALGFLNESPVGPEKLPHICWCPSGPAATYLPFHAAGNYDLGPEHWASTHIVSSYTTTLTSLLQAYERAPDTQPCDIRMLLVSQSNTPLSRSLPCVNEERDGIIRTIRLPENNNRFKLTVLHDSAGRIADVKTMLSVHQILHLACHGKQSKDDPLESAILLHDGSLTLREIIKTPIPSAELVYLSACQTATGDINSPDESLSIAGGFLFCGYRSAVATMWSINDEDGANVAQAFYRYLTMHQGLPAPNAPLALHKAVQDFRAANPDMDFIRWIPFMCLGVTAGPS